MMSKSAALQEEPTTTTGGGRPPFKVKDLSLAEWGRKEIRLAEQEMPGLMAARREYGPQQPLAGLRVMGSLHNLLDSGPRRRCSGRGARGHS
jgi:adenosylhomocysteinase